MALAERATWRKNKPRLSSVKASPAGQRSNQLVNGSCGGRLGSAGQWRVEAARSAWEMRLTDLTWRVWRVGGRCRHSSSSIWRVRARVRTAEAGPHARPLWRRVRARGNLFSDCFCFSRLVWTSRTDWCSQTRIRSIFEKSSDPWRRVRARVRDWGQSSPSLDKRVQRVAATRSDAP